MTALDLEAVQKVPDEGTDWGKAIEDYNALIAEVRKLRLVLERAREEVGVAMAAEIDEVLPR